MEHLVYCNNAASTWPKPPEVIDAVMESLKLPYFEAGRSTIKGLQDYPEMTREILGSFLGAESPDQVVFTQNATDSLNLLIHGFCAREKAPFHVLTSDIEHNSVLRPLKTLESLGKIRLTIIETDQGYIPPESVESAVTSTARLAVFSHGSNVLGTLQDIRAIGECLQDHNVMFIVDGAQTAGLVGIDFHRTPIDAFVFTGHKFLFGLPGIGGFLIRDPSRVAACKQGGTGVDSGNLFQPDDLPLKFETGTHNYPGIVSLMAGTRFVEKTTIRGIQEKGRAMICSIIEDLEDCRNVTIDTPSPDLPVISLNIDSLDCDDVGFILLKNYHIVVRAGLHCAPLLHDRMNGKQGSVRISLSCLNTIHECGYVTKAIREVARSADH